MKILTSGQRIRREKFRGVLVRGDGFESGFLLKNDIVFLAPSPFGHMQGWKLRQLMAEIKRKKFAYTMRPTHEKYAYISKRDSLKSLKKKINQLEGQLSYIQMLAIAGDNNLMPYDPDKSNTTSDLVLDLRKKYNSLSEAFNVICTTIQGLRQ